MQRCWMAVGGVRVMEGVLRANGKNTMGAEALRLRPQRAWTIHVEFEGKDVDDGH